MSFSNHKTQSPWPQEKPDYLLRYKTSIYNNVFYSGNRDRDPRASMSTHPHSSTLLLLRVCDGCQLDWIWNQLRDIPPVGGSVMVFPGRINWGKSYFQ